MDKRFTYDPYINEDHLYATYAEALKEAKDALYTPGSSRYIMEVKGKVSLDKTPPEDLKVEEYN